MERSTPLTRLKESEARSRDTSASSRRRWSAGATLNGHSTIRVSDRAASERFYETVLPTLGIEQTHRSEPYTEWRDFSLASADERNKVTRRLHIAFVAPTRAHADEFCRVGTAAGYRDDGAP